MAFLNVPEVLMSQFYNKCEQFLEQYRYDNGDKTESASNFLNIILSQLAEEMIQDYK